MQTEFNLPIQDLLHFVKESCHEGLHAALIDLREGLLKMKKNPRCPQGLPDYLTNFIQDLQRHLVLEENNLFPPHADGQKFIPHLVDEHHEMKHALIELREWTQNYQEENDPDCMEFYQKLKEMDRILQNHIQIEDHILFPMLLSH